MGEGECGALHITKEEEMNQQRLIAAMAQALEDAAKTLSYHKPEQFDDDLHRSFWNGRLANYLALANIAKATLTTIEKGGANV